MRQKTADAARGKWRGILMALGLPEGHLDFRHHPCPKDGQGKDRFRFTDRERYFCSCAHGGDGFELLKCCRGWSFEEAAREVDAVVCNVESEPPKAPIDARPRLEKVWKDTTRAGPAVVSYLQARGLPVPPVLRQWRGEYWQHTENGPIRGDTYDVMVAQIKDAAGETVSLHQTYLQGGQKAPVECPRKIMTPIRSINGAAIRLFPWEKGEDLGIGEGIETAIAAGILHNMTVWSVSNRNGIETFNPPEGAKVVHIFGDTDKSFAGQAGAYRGAERLVRNGFEVYVHLPESGDWNDVLLLRNKQTD